jgi:hypothetical protein
MAILVLSYELVQMRKRVDDNKYTIDEIINAQLLGEEKGLLQATGILVDSARLYGPPSGLVTTVTTKLTDHLKGIQRIIASRRS